MSSTLETLRAKAAEAADRAHRFALDEEKALTEVKARNQERKTAFWTDVKDGQLQEAKQAVADAEKAFNGVVAAGGDATSAYVDYCKAFRFHQQLNNAAATALRWFVDESGRRHDETWGRVQYPEGLGQQIHDPREFGCMFADAVKAAAKAHAKDATDAVVAPLRASLEPEQ